MILFFIKLNSASIDAIDLSGVDLINFPYFRYSEQKNTNNNAELSTLETGLNSLNAVSTYFRNLILGADWTRQNLQISFDPEAGRKNSIGYQRYYGHLGENLIALVGEGYNPERIVQRH